MKSTIKTLALMFTLTFPMFFFASCSDDDDDNKTEEYIPVTQSEIQGSWAMLSGTNVYYHITFSGNSYSLNLMDAKTSDWVHRENGTYTLDGINISVDGEVTYNNTSSTNLIMDGNRIYWETSAKNVLHIWTLGSFSKVN